MREIIKRRVNDGGIIRLIGKFLNAGVLEGELEGETLTHPEKGTPQGGVISPMLANIFLHQVLDEWYEQQIKPRLKGRSFLIRFADDLIIGCEREEDARRVMEVLPKRFACYGLTIHPEKTALVRFGKPNSRKEGASGNGTFDFLGFTHYWAKSRRGYWVIKRETARKRMRRTMKAIWRWCERNRHMPLKEQFKELSQKLRGHFQYYGIRGNYRMLEVVFEHAEKTWRYWLSRRSHKSAISWEKSERMQLSYLLPKPKIVYYI
ncbi:reverse transcriptase domain-containing protein [Dehalococcoidia bacterium]|nr:reverse transcriptase domain-containing protein [Dehalococcoidia bacterium]